MSQLPPVSRADERWAGLLLNQMITYSPKGENDMSVNEFWEWWDKHGGFVVGLGLIVLGVALTFPVESIWLCSAPC
jgi:hypothetical protein